MLWAELNHAVCQLVVHVILHASGRIFLLRRLFADDLRLDWARCGESGHHCLGLELNQSLRQDWVVHTASTNPWVGTFFDLHAQQFDAVDVCLHPVFA